MTDNKQVVTNKQKVKNALALHRSMVFSGEDISDVSEQRYDEALTALDGLIDKAGFIEWLEGMKRVMRGIQNDDDVTPHQHGYDSGYNAAIAAIIKELRDENPYTSPEYNDGYM